MGFGTSFTNLRKRRLRNKSLVETRKLLPDAKCTSFRVHLLDLQKCSLGPIGELKRLLQCYFVHTLYQRVAFKREQLY
jgi:hypothetical protein